MSTAIPGVSPSYAQPARFETRRPESSGRVDGLTHQSHRNGALLEAPHRLIQIRRIEPLSAARAEHTVQDRWACAPEMSASGLARCRHPHSGFARHVGVRRRGVGLQRLDEPRVINALHDLRAMLLSALSSLRLPLPSSPPSARRRRADTLSAARGKRIQKKTQAVETRLAHGRS